MRKQSILKNVPRLLTVIINLLLFVAVFFLMNYVQALLNSDVKINLNEVVSQNKDVITSKLNLEMNNVELIATRLGDRLAMQNQPSDAAMLKEFEDLVAIEDHDEYFIANADGVAYLTDDNIIDISGRKYYRSVMEGYPNISDRLVSRKDGTDIFIISVPLKVDNQIIGSVQKFYSVQEMYDLCSLSLFSAKGYMTIINSDGYVLISTQYKEYNQEMDNYFRLLYSQGNQSESTTLENDININKEGFMETVSDGEKVFSAYTPIEGIYDWYLITSVANSAVSPNGTLVIRMFYFILSVIILVFGCSMFYFFYYKNKQQNNLKKVAFVDNITQGRTFTKFMVDFQEIMRHPTETQYYLLKFDIDNFKYVNTYYGFDFGDKILYQIYQTINEKLEGDEMISRISSDHFIVLLEQADDHRLKQLISSIESEEGFILYLSAGLYHITNREESINLMVDKASTAAQTSKGSMDKKIQLYSQKFDEQMIHNEQMKRNVKQALADNEIVPFYQPKIDVNTGSVVGAEALARWVCKDGRIIPPNDFIPLCEKSGLVIDLDMKIFEGVLKFLRKQLDEHQPCVTVSVNFSRLHFMNKGFIQKIEDLLEQYQVPARYIEMEVTESAFFDNAAIMNDLVREIHSAGLSISMDDFGSGYSSLNMLKDVPIDVLKIDRGFLIETANSSKQRIIFSAIASMARQLHIKVVVEGVETEENIAMMKEFGCTIAQGYYYAKPMNEDLFKNYVREGSR